MFNLKPTHKNVVAYYESLDKYESLGATHEGAVREAFQGLIKSCEKQFQWTLVPEYSINVERNKRIVVDGALIDDFLTHGIWEAKDIHDDLEYEVQRKFDAGYPNDNILFQTPHRAILWQNAELVFDVDLKDRLLLIKTLETFFSYRPVAIDEWEKATDQFKDQVPNIGKGLAELIKRERTRNNRFSTAFNGFLSKCRISINPNLSEAAVEEMLVQHLLTERIFRTVFDNPDFARRNVIANEIENVIDALTSQSFNRREFLQGLDTFYIAIERVAATIGDYNHKQQFLNSVYERFFQGFSVAIADTHGIVYTPQQIVEFMVKSVDRILETEFGKSLSDSGVHVIDPFVGTGNFIVKTMREIRKTALEGKYRTELHCNEVMLLPYYIASMNIEHEYYEATEVYEVFKGICLVDTFDLIEAKQIELFTEENSERVERQKKTNMFVIIGNPPYNVGQINENDNNKNRKYVEMDNRVRNTYANDSNSSYKGKLYDTYVKSLRWASDRIGDRGIVAFITNNNFIDGIAFDGMRKHLADEFDKVYVLDLGGNTRKSSRGLDSNVFNIRVSVCIGFYIKKGQSSDSQITENSLKIHYSKLDQSLNRTEKLNYLKSKEHLYNIDWSLLTPNEDHKWLTKGLHKEFKSYIPIGIRKKATDNFRKTSDVTPSVVFDTYSLGVSTNRDAWVRNFNLTSLSSNVSRLIDYYNAEVDRWNRMGRKTKDIDTFVSYSDTDISWSSGLKQKLKSGKTSQYSKHKIRRSLYRPFTVSYLYFDDLLVDRVLRFPLIFPTQKSESENLVIIVSDRGYRTGFSTLMANMIPDLHVLATTDAFQCFPFYIYSVDGSKRVENINNFVLSMFQDRYADATITKWDIFLYVYGILHHSAYSERYKVDLYNELPRIPLIKEFRRVVNSGRRLAELHTKFEQQPKFPIHTIENPASSLNWRVNKMHLSKDKRTLYYNDLLSLSGIPQEAFEYKLGNRSALEWVIDQYCVNTDTRSGIVSDPNRDDDQEYIIRLISKVITVSIETTKVVSELSSCALDENWN